jgi:hypothetical protein
LPDHIGFTARIVPLSNPYQRPGYRMWGGSPSGTINHETDNYAVGADSLMHAQYLLNGPVDRDGNRMEVSWHFAVDGGSSSKGHGPMVSQSIPCDEVSWQAACGACGGNYDRVSIEQCKNPDGDVAAARDTHEWLTASLHETMDIAPVPDKTLDLHWTWNAGTANRHHCPDTMLSDGYIPTFNANVQAKYLKIRALRNALENPGPPPPPPPTYAAAVLPDWFDRMDAKEHPSDQKWNGATAYVAKRNYRNISGRSTQRYSSPYARGEAGTAPSGPKVIAGEKVFGIRLWSHPKDGRLWILEESGHWLLASKFTPGVRIDPRTLTDEAKAEKEGIPG